MSVLIVLGSELKSITSATTSAITIRIERKQCQTEVRPVTLLDYWIILESRLRYLYKALIGLECLILNGGKAQRQDSAKKQW